MVNTSAETTEKELVLGYGLRSLQQRASDLGGTMTADFTPDGFALTVLIPTKEHHDRA